MKNLIYNGTNQIVTGDFSFHYIFNIKSPHFSLNLIFRQFRIKSSELEINSISLKLLKNV